MATHTGTGRHQTTTTPEDTERHVEPGSVRGASNPNLHSYVLPRMGQQVARAIEEALGG
jgi:hypothetical protein